jgi:hypothetical protein
MRGKQLGHFEHCDLLLTKYGFEFCVGVDVALVFRCLQVVGLDVFPYFFRNLSARDGLTANDSGEFRRRGQRFIETSWCACGFCGRCFFLLRVISLRL